MEKEGADPPQLTPEPSPKRLDKLSIRCYNRVIEWEIVLIRQVAFILCAFVVDTTVL
jgi:hypothetical protein